MRRPERSRPGPALLLQDRRPGAYEIDDLLALGASCVLYKPFRLSEGVEAVRQSSPAGGFPSCPSAIVGPFLAEAGVWRNSQKWACLADRDSSRLSQVRPKPHRGVTLKVE